MKSKTLVILGLVTLGLALSGCSGGTIPGRHENKDIQNGDGKGGDIQDILIGDLNQDGVTDSDIFLDLTGDLTHPDGSGHLDGSPTGGDTDVKTDQADSEVGANCPGNEGCPCETNSDCYSGFCIEGPDGNECAQMCSTGEECPANYTCKSVQTGGGDVAYICVYMYPKLCMPCSEDAQCQGKFSGEGAKCVKGVATDNNQPTEGETVEVDAFCGSACKEDGDCPAGYKCMDVVTTAGNDDRQCVPENGSCGCTAKAKELNATGKCFKQNQFGECEGTFSCFKDKDASCDAPEPAKEECNGKDDDCDGETDEDFDLNTDVNNCGGCGNACTNEHGTTSCEDGKCVPQCADGFGDCDRDPNNGCETDLSTVDSCGTCMKDEDCYDGFFCKDGVCVKKYENGHSCDTDKECSGGFCTDEKVCCDKACDGPCQSCKSGTCVPVGKDSKPEEDDACGGFMCDGEGACLGTCSGPQDCLESYYCELSDDSPDKGKCLPDQGPGGDCKDEGPDACKSGMCADGVCCTSACNGTCQHCDASGECKAVVNEEDPDTCFGEKACDASGSCKLKDGQPCTSNADCLGGICKDGFCCPSACDGPCQVCTANGCEAVKGEDDKPECTGDHTCNDQGECVLKGGQPCQKDSDCASGICKHDFDGTGAWCATSQNECWHDATAFHEGEHPQTCKDSFTMWVCKNGKWTPQACNPPTCKGDCGSSMDGCKYHNFVCSAGECIDNPLDPDTSEKACRGCNLKWGIGGDVAASTCCGDDSGEYITNCKDDSANGNCGSDTLACCSDKNDCVDHHGNCVRPNICTVFGTKNKLSYCDNGTWKDPDATATYCSACGFDWIRNGTGGGSKCCGDDPGEDFEASSGDCCYNGQRLSDGDSIGPILCYHGKLYNCNGAAHDDSGLGEYKNTCDGVGGMYCSADNNWKRGKDNLCQCSTNGECLSGSCKQDFVGSGKWCVSWNQCVHNGQAYNSGDVADQCMSSTQQAKCVNGAWVGVSCGNSTACTYHYCSQGECKIGYKGTNTRCNSTYRCSSGTGDNRYGAGGNYRCQGYCDGHGNCDYAGNCDNCTDNFAHGTGICSYNSCRLSSCNWGYANCDGNQSNGCETHLSSTSGTCGSPATTMSQICGDKSDSYTTVSYKGSRWLKIYAKECVRHLWDDDPQITVTLNVPSGADYDLYLYDSGCRRLRYSTHSGNGVNEKVIYGWEDSNSDDSRWFKIYVKYRGGSSCSNWSLTVNGGTH